MRNNIFCKPAPKFICIIREGSIDFISVLNSKRQSYQCLQNKNPLSGCKVSTFFSFCQCLRWPFSRPYILLARAVTTVTSHYSTAANTFLTLFMSQINLKMHINEQIIAKLCGEFKYECLRRWLSKVLARDTWKICHGKYSYFLINAPMMDSGGLERGWSENWRGIDLVHNKYNTTFLGLLADHRLLFYKI